eukprot:jgi/Mesen1/5632/ME000283S04806
MASVTLHQAVCLGCLRQGKAPEFVGGSIRSSSASLTPRAHFKITVSCGDGVSRLPRLRSSSFMQGEHGIDDLFVKRTTEEGSRRLCKYVYSAVAIVKKSPKRMKYAAGSKKGSEQLYLQVDPLGLDVGRLQPVIDMIKKGGVGIIPTDTVYAIVCDLKSRESVERLYRIKDMDPKKPLSILCRNFQDIDTYTMGFPRGNGAGQTNIFRAARQCLPGPASKEMPKQCITFGGSMAARCAPRKSVGVRMPEDAICQAILAQLDEPLLCTSVTQPAGEWLLDPALIFDMYGSADGGRGVDFVVDGGVRVAEPSTVVDMTGEKPIVLRQGKGEVADFMLLESHDSAELLLAEGVNPYAAR